LTLPGVTVADLVVVVTASHLVVAAIANPTTKTENLLTRTDPLFLRIKVIVHHGLKAADQITSAEITIIVTEVQEARIVHKFSLIARIRQTSNNNSLY
jgi:thiamine biosynthesis lipoprotein ApbE